MEDLVGDVVDQVTDQVFNTVQNSIWRKIGGYFKDNWLTIIGTLFSSTTATTSLAKAERLFEILTVDCED